MKNDSSNRFNEILSIYEEKICKFKDKPKKLPIKNKAL